MKARSSLSLEPILLGPVTYKVSGVETSPTAFTVDAQFTAPYSDPSGTWASATWETITTGGSTAYWARVPIGPGSTVGALANGRHRAWIRVTVSASEVPILDAGELVIL